MTYVWQFSTLGQRTSSEITWLIQLLCKESNHRSLSSYPISYLDQKESTSHKEQRRGGPLSVTYLWSTFDLINIHEGATSWRSSEREVGWAKSFVMKYSARSTKLSNVSHLFGFDKLNLLKFFLISYIRYAYAWAHLILKIFAMQLV